MSEMSQQREDARDRSFEPAMLDGSEPKDPNRQADDIWQHQRQRSNSNSLGMQSQPGTAPSGQLPHGNTSTGKVGQGHIGLGPSGPPSNTGTVDARIDIHGDDGRTYQAPSFYKQHVDLRALQIGQRVCFKAWHDRFGFWAFDLTLLHESASLQQSNL